MTFMDRFTRILSRRSGSSSSSDGSETTAGTSPISSAEPLPDREDDTHSLAKQQNNRPRAWTWRSRKTPPPSPTTDVRPPTEWPLSNTEHAVQTPTPVATQAPTPKKKPRQILEAPKPQKMHPSERPFTETNLKYQALLGGYTVKFGREMSASEYSDINISPRGSRIGSSDFDFDFEEQGQGQGPLSTES